LGELIENVKQSLDENDNKVKEIEERVDRFIKEQHDHKNQYEPTSAPVFRQYQRKEDENFGNIFSTQYPVQREAPINQQFVQENPFSGMMKTNASGFVGTQENPFLSSTKMDNEYMKPTIPEWGSSYSSTGYSIPRPIGTQGFTQQYVDPGIEAKEKMMKALDYFLKNNVDCLFNSSEQVFMFMQGKLKFNLICFRNNMEVSSR
jgi:hypothetical protein